MSSITLASCNLHSDDSSSRLCETSGLHRSQETTTGSRTMLPGGPQGAAPREPQGVQSRLRLLRRGAEQGPCLSCPCLSPSLGAARAQSTLCHVPSMPLFHLHALLRHAHQNQWPQRCLEMLTVFQELPSLV